jgi:hypothetical protein
MRGRSDCLLRRRMFVRKIKVVKERVEKIADLKEQVSEVLDLRNVSCMFHQCLQAHLWISYSFDPLVHPCP